MSRSLPGFCAGGQVREFLYIEAASDEDFASLINQAMTLPSEISMPTSGGAIEEKVRLTLADGISLLALSYKGDLPGWRNKIGEFADRSGRRWGVVANRRLVLSDGTVVRPADCRIRFEP